MSARWTPDEDARLKATVSQVAHENPVRFPAAPEWDEPERELVVRSLDAKELGYWRVGADDRKAWDIVAERMDRSAQACVSRFRPRERNLS
jgi:Myb-like DNA-binding domain